MKLKDIPKKTRDKIASMLSDIIDGVKALVSDRKSQANKMQPLVAQKYEQMRKIAEAFGMPIRITSGYRSFKEQAELYARGRRGSGNIVTNAKPGESMHNYGVAFDVVFTRTGYDGDWKTLGELGEALGLEWGGRWESFTDRPHFQLTLGYSLSDFQNERVDWSRFERCPK